MASQSADTGGDGNQVHPLRSPIPSVRGKANRHHSTRVFRSHVVLDDGRSGKQAARFQDLLQPPSHAYLTGRANAGSARVTTSSQSQLISLATSLPILISDANGCLTTRAHRGIRSTSAKTWNEIIRCLRSWLQRASRLRSFHCHRARPESETQPTFATRLSVGSPVTIRQEQEDYPRDLLELETRFSIEAPNHWSNDPQ